jgi:uncharacterized protein
MRLFVFPIFVSLIALGGIYIWGGAQALVLAAALAALEISLSFDNAVLNAKILARMSHVWQRHFLTWGMPLAVFGVRFLLPVLIIAAAAFVSPVTIATIAFTDPARYAALLTNVDPLIHAFGGSFLLMVALNYFFDEEKRLHWIVALERQFAKWGRVAALETLIAFVAVALVSPFSVAPWATFVAGLVGIALYIAIDKLVMGWAGRVRGVGAPAGIALFVYLNVLDAAFSLDGVVGAFALTTQILVILVGLGIGAYFVRSFTVYLTQRKTIETFIYLEHGAHWAIFSLALCLFAALFIRVPEVLPGSVGLVFAVLSYLSSRRELRYK